METRPVFPAPIRNDWKTFRESNTPLISITGATIRYGNKTVLDNIDWTVHAGEHWAIVGPNGAGKSTLLSLVLGDCPQSYAQNIRLWGRRRGTGESIWDLRKNIGFVCSESHTFHPPEADCLSTVLSGFHETIGLYKFCAKSEHDHAFRWMQSLGIEKLASRPFGELSLGEQRLVLLARALVRDPVLLILDEICQSLGEESRAAILRILEQLCQHDLPLSLICVSHHWDEIPDSVRYRMHMKNGLIMKSK
jgi:molybdate transport system ATP-binding protein